MINKAAVLRGTVRGRTIELEQESELPDGQEVTIVVQPLLPPGEGIRRSAGAWADAGEALDAWLEESRRSRENSRPDPPECS